MNPDLIGGSGRAEAGPGNGMDPTADLLAIISLKMNN